MKHCIMPGCDNPADNYNFKADYYKCDSCKSDEIEREYNTTVWDIIEKVTARKAMDKLMYNVSELFQ